MCRSAKRCRPASASPRPPCPKVCPSSRRSRSRARRGACHAKACSSATRGSSKRSDASTCCASTRPAPSPKVASSCGRCPTVRSSRRCRPSTDDGVWCSRARCARRPAPRRRELPHPTDQVVVDGAAAVELGTELGAPGWRKVASLPFAPSRGYHAVLGDAEAGSLLSVKGAPEVVLPRCATWRRGEHASAVDDRVRSRLERHVERLARQGLRVLAVAERHASGRADLDDARVSRLELLGFVTVADVARPSAITPIAQLQRAGIAVVMLTGDHPSTAEAIASELGLLDGGVVSGTRDRPARRHATRRARRARRRCSRVSRPRTRFVSSKRSSGAVASSR